MTEQTSGSGARLVAHPTPGKVWVQIPHRNDIGSDWIAVDELPATPDADDASEVKHDHAEPRPGCRCAERHALSRGMTTEEAERAREFFGTLTSPDASTGASELGGER